MCQRGLRSSQLGERLTFILEVGESVLEEGVEAGEFCVRGCVCMCVCVRS